MADPSKSPLGNKGDICFYTALKTTQFKHCSKALNMSTLLSTFGLYFFPLK